MATIPAERQVERLARRAASYEAYLALPDDGRLVEWVDGEIIEHMPPTEGHQNIVIYLAALLRGYVNKLHLGRVLMAPFPVQLWPGGPVREPDVLFIGRDRLPLSHPTRFEGAPDLVVELISPASVTIDRITKFREYEQAGVREYWIIDPRPHQQQADCYSRDEEGHFVPLPPDEAGVFWSQVVPGFRIPVNRLWLVGPEDELPDFDLPLAEMLADAPGLPDELRAAYRELARLLGAE
jgi:Uma2 family endonuclease